jgi:hypothetical protein
MAKEKSRYTMTNPTTKVEVESGLLLIKAYLKLASLDTGGIALIAEQQIIKMPNKFESAYGNDPITFLDQLQVHLNTLEYNGDPMKETQVVTVIFNAMNQVKQECFKTWIDKRYDEFALEPKKANSRDLMLKIREKVSLLKAEGKWDPDAQTLAEEVMALRAEVKKFALQQSHNKTTKSMDKERTTPPGPGEPKSKMMKSLYDGNLKMHYYCPQCAKWVIHKVHRDGYKTKAQRLREKSKGKPAPAKKKGNPKEGKKKAYAQATLAYKAALAKIDSEYQQNEEEQGEDMEIESVDEMYEE